MGGLPTHSTFERYAIPFIIKYFYLLIVVWLLAIAVPLYFSTPGNNFVALSSGVIGAGPFMLYYLYSEYHKVPWLDIPDKEDDETREESVREAEELSIYFDKKLLWDDNIVYPIIEVVAAVKNIGNATGCNCRARVCLDEGTNSEHEYLSRWMGAGYAPEIDIDPQEVRDLILFQLVPNQESIQSLRERLAETEFELDRAPFKSLTIGEPSPDMLSIDQCDFEVQRPMNPKYEESYFSEKDFTRLDKHRFIGYSIACDYDHEVKIKFLGENLYRECDIGTISIVDAARRSKWGYGPDRYSEVRSIVDEDLLADG